MRPRHCSHVLQAHMAALLALRGGVRERGVPSAASAATCGGGWRPYATSCAHEDLPAARRWRSAGAVDTKLARRASDHRRQVRGRQSWPLAEFWLRRRWRRAGESGGRRVQRRSSHGAGGGAAAGSQGEGGVGGAGRLDAERPGRRAVRRRAGRRARTVLRVPLQPPSRTPHAAAAVTHAACRNETSREGDAGTGRWICGAASRDAASRGEGGVGGRRRGCEGMGDGELSGRRPGGVICGRMGAERRKIACRDSNGRITTVSGLTKRMR
ncbi:hypothetical protein PVAP13_7NG055956 [Panicum virgatum]|uniref:Uncharacterized protein n=1 Tax=Panicum virgatum TaxID=38727 RepID=A0A8T0PRU4_PANVG|nr:hypothetical protein PVAP13_7NG055956 [Panicum virgatum]